MKKSVYIYGSYRKIKTGVSLFLDHSVYLLQIQNLYPVEVRDITGVN